MGENTTSIITLLITGITVLWGVIIALILYVRHLHNRAVKQEEEHKSEMVKVMVEQKGEIVDITKKFTEVVTTVNQSLLAMDRRSEGQARLIETSIERNTKSYEELHRAVLGAQK